ALQYRCNVRIIAATHRNLEESIRQGTFREDLFYRLNVFPIDMPSLRSRKEDLPTLIRDFAEMNVAAGRSRVLLTEGAMECLERYDWPGNVRELGNLIERLSILCGGRPVGVADLPPRYRPADWTPPPGSERVAGVFSFPAVVPAPAAFAPSVPAAAVPASFAAEPPAREPAPMTDEDETRISEREVLLMLEDPVPASGAILPPGGIDLRAHVSAIEESLIRQALERSNGVVAQAARLLGLRRTTLVEKLRKFGINGADEATAD
ncbi:MAG: helix-turn-helix domain-containing protein, partial [Pseudomonadota bacterium]